MLLRHLLEQFLDELDIRPVGHAHSDLLPNHTPVARPVGELAGQELRIRHEDDGIVERLHLRGTDIDAPDDAGDAAHVNDVAFAQGLPEDDQKPADEVVDDVLEAKADAYGQAAGDHRDAGQAEPKRAQVYKPNKPHRRYVNPA